MPFSHELGEEIRDGFAALKAEMLSKVPELIGEGQGDTEVDELMLDTEILRRSAFLFTNVWLGDALERILDPSPPAMMNSDGDEIAFTTVRYPLKEAIHREALEGQLTTIPELRRSGHGHWNWVAPAMQGAGVAPKGARIFISTLEDGSVSMGDVELEADVLELEANSPQRAQKGRALLEPVIGPFVGEPVVASRTLAETIASRPADEGPASASGLSPEEESAVVRDALDRHYRRLLDGPVPMLGDLTPRKAAKTRDGREKLVDWLKLHGNAAAREEPGSPMASYDMSCLWEELGVADLRR